MVTKISPAEQRVMELIMLGLANKEISRKLGSSEATIKVHVKSLLRQFGLKNRTLLAIEGHKLAGMISGIVPAVMADNWTYQKPEHGWTCFHCGDTFTSVWAAKAHFGMDPTFEPACRIKLGAEMSLLKKLRDVEIENVELRRQVLEEDTQACRAMHGMSARHVSQLQAAEELGYERGLRDARAEQQTVGVVS